MPTKPSKLQGTRTTSPGLRKSQLKGRPPGTRLKRQFEETRLGFMLKYETPLEFELIMQATKKAVFKKPDINLIEAVCSASDDISFNKAKFKKYLQEYRDHGIHCDRPKVITPERERYYELLRRNKTKAYMVGKKKMLKKLQ